MRLLRFKRCQLGDRWWDFGLDFTFVGDESGVQSEVAECDSDIAFGIACFMAVQDVAVVLDRGVGAFVESYRLSLCRGQFCFFAWCGF